jgi:hypothetical protein
MPRRGKTKRIPVWDPAGQGCSKVRAIAANTAQAALKSEDRKPKTERNPKPEIREGLQPLTGPAASAANLSGLRISGFLRISVFGLRI